jgi:hypothetical protein
MVQKIQNLKAERFVARAFGIEVGLANRGRANF